MNTNVSICKLTHLVKINESQSENGIFYSVMLDGEELEFRFCRNCYKKIQIERNKEIIVSLLLNGKIPNSENGLLHWGDDGIIKDHDAIDLEKIIATGVYPRSPKEKAENLFMELFKLQKHDGQVIEIGSLGYFTRRRALSLYFKNRDELMYYTRALAAQKDIELVDNRDANNIIRLSFTFQGLNNYINLFEKGYNSKNCFVAMSFSEDPLIKSIRENIKEAILETGYVPILIDEQHIGGKTIVDEMIHRIRNCKFCISDFTEQRHGVYFEGGLAIGAGKPVIYTCQKDDFPNVHFDIKQLQHIIYNTPEELKTALKHKIKAWIL